MIAGVDEAGRGPLAGPVVAAAVILDSGRRIPGLRDSKQLTAEQRGRLAVRIRERALAFAIAQAEPEEIDRLNILQASLLAMRRALLRLTHVPRQIAVDGPYAPWLGDCFEGCIVSTLIGGDDLLPCISAASILAKTYRDALMVELDRSYPGYGMAQHFGYGTRAHLAALSRLGPSPIHRRSFAPVRIAMRGGWPEAEAINAGACASAATGAGVAADAEAGANAGTRVDASVLDLWVAPQTGTAL